jgi:hypothetical protein
MPIRFTTEAANADRMNPDGEAALPPPRGEARGPYERPLRRDTPTDNSIAGKPGRDINAAGFLKDPSPSTD